MTHTIYVDENVGRRLTTRLIEHGFEIKTHEDVGLPRGTSDEEWIPIVAEQGWSAITADIKQSRKTNEWRAIQRGPLKHIVIHAKKLTAALAIEILDEHITTLKVVLAYLPPPFTLRLLQRNVQLRSYHTGYEETLDTFPVPQQLNRHSSHG